MERFKFHNRSRKPGESVATFVAELRSLTEFCNFGTTLSQSQNQRSRERRGTKNLLCYLKSLGVSISPPIMVKVRVDDCLISMEVDTGAAHSLISKKTFESLWPGRSLNPTTIRI
jgi:hypothetical protein